MRSKISLLSLSLFALALASPAFGAISFTNGYWSSSFMGCATGDVVQGYTCDGLDVDYYPTTCDGHNSMVDTSGNNSIGAGGNGYRALMATERNVQTTSMQMNFPTPQKEVWLRFYYRIPAGQRSSSLYEHKIIYAFTNSGVSANVNWPGGNSNNIELQPRGTMGSPDIYYTGSGTHQVNGSHSCPNGGPGGGWSTVYGGLPSAVSADGTWHYYEFYFDLGTSGGNNGKFHMWVDGINYVHDDGLDWFNGGASSPTGWTRITIPSNHNTWTLAGCPSHSVDDIAAAVPSFAGFVHDSGGRSMIGGLSAEPPRTQLMSEPFDDTAFSGRGWYDGTETASTITTAEHIPGSTASFQCVFPLGGTACSGGTPQRRAITPTDKMYVSYWVKHSVNWVGSGLSYHPHVIYFMSNLDHALNGGYHGPSEAYLTTYLEDNGGHQRINFQDVYNISAAYSIPWASTHATEARAVSACNGDSMQGVGTMDCYAFPGAPSGMPPVNFRNERVFSSPQVLYSDTPGSYYKGDWHHIEAYLKMNTVSGGIGQNDGIMLLKYDGTPIFNYTGLLYRTGNTGPPNRSTMTWQEVMLAPYIGDGSPVDNQVLYIDNFEVWDTPPSGFLDVLDTLPPAISAGAPSGTLAAGTTSTTMSVVTDESASCKYGTSNVSYAALPNFFSTTGGTSHSQSLTGLTNGSSYSYFVRCQDSSLNTNASGYPISFSVAVVSDTTPPIRSAGSPSGELQAGTTGTTISLTTDEAATCRYGTTPGVAYGSKTLFGTTGGTSHSQSLSGLTNGGSYAYYVRCQDSYANANTDDYGISFSVGSSGAAAPSGIAVRNSGLVGATVQ